MSIHDELASLCSNEDASSSIIVACQLFVPSARFHDYGQRYELLERYLNDDDRSGVEQVLGERMKSLGIPWFSVHGERADAVGFIKRIYEEARARGIHDGYMVTAFDGGNVLVSIWPDM